MDFFSLESWGTGVASNPSKYQCGPKCKDHFEAQLYIFLLPHLVAHPTNRKWFITPVINGISRVNPLITGVITHLLSGMSHQACIKEVKKKCLEPQPSSQEI